MNHDKVTVDLLTIILYARCTAKPINSLPSFAALGPLGFAFALVNTIAVVALATFVALATLVTLATINIHHCPIVRVVLAFALALALEGSLALAVVAFGRERLALAVERRQNDEARAKAEARELALEVGTLRLLPL